MRWAWRTAQSLVGVTGAAVIVGEGSERYDASRQVEYAMQRLHARYTRLENENSSNDEGETQPLWLQREIPKFPYIVAISPADNPANVTRALLGTSEHIIGSPDDTTRATMDTLVIPEASFDALVQRVALQWNAFKTALHGNLPLAFDPQRSVLSRRLDVMLEALRELNQQGNEKPQANDKLVFFLRDFDDWDETTKTAWLQWTHDVTNAGLAHVVLPTTSAITPAAISELQRVHKVPDVDFVAILLRAATRACDPSSALEKLRGLSQRMALELRGLEHDTSNGTTDHDVIGFESLAPPSEASLIMETVGEWYRDLELVCRALEIRGLSQLTSDDERLVLIQRVCEEYERETMIHILSTLEVVEDDNSHNDPESRERRLTALHAWKCLEVVTGVGDNAQILTSPEKMLQKDTSKPINCVDPVEALLPFNQRSHGEAKFLDLVDHGILFLRPKTNVEIGVVPCDAKSLVAPCWIETRPLIKRAMDKLWRDDAHYTKILELERFEDKHKMQEEVILFEQEIHERRMVLDAQTRELIMLQHTMKKHEVAQRRAELSLLELEIQSKLVYLERLRSLVN